ncbi:hypothetical protein CUJ83_11820 [Methanocella sp. CWC-04]|uniref:SIMPL domain-containing protein n=2 Tax=Methanooceanicella nereidis TaxID=2052831 RepID=A0AAP2RFL1_9EURY|nr:hypothetical protein [Methanocella sp. CWC-04]
MEFKRGFLFGLGMITAFAVLLAVLGNSCVNGIGVASSASENNESERTVTVTGNGYVYTEPDIAKVSVGVVTEANTSSEAMQMNADQMDAVMKSVRRLGIPEKDIKTSQISVQPVYNYQYQPKDATEKPKIVGYKASNTVTITVRDMSKVGPVIDASYGSGSNKIDGVSFMLSEEKQSLVYKQALEKAVKDGADKAKTIASAADIEGMKLKTISESGGFYPVYYDSYNMAAAERASGAAPTPVSPGEQKVQATVTMVYTFG